MIMLVHASLGLAESCMLFFAKIYKDFDPIIAIDMYMLIPSILRDADFSRLLIEDL